MPNFEIGTISANSPQQVAVGTSSAAIVAASLSGDTTSRVGLVVTNLSTGTIYLAFRHAAVLGSGIPLLPSGGNFSMDDYNYTKEAVNGIAHSASSLVSFQEYYN